LQSESVSLVIKKVVGYAEHKDDADWVKQCIVIEGQWNETVRTAMGDSVVLCHGRCLKLWPVT